MTTALGKCSTAKLCVIFDSEENARAAGDRVSAIAADARDDVTLDGVEVREVVASA
jgi:hypothetical protein